MKTITQQNFNALGSFAFPDAGVVALSIAPGSTTARCLVNDVLLTPGAVVPYRPGYTIRAVDGWRTGPDIATAGNVAPTGVNRLTVNAGMPTLQDQLVLLAYECDDDIEPSSLGLGAYTQQVRTPSAPIPPAAFVLAHRQIITGRRGGLVTLRRGDATESYGAIAIRLVKYFTRDHCVIDRSGGFAASPPCHFNDYGTTATFMTSAIVGAPNYTPATEYIWSNGFQANTHHYDELEIWLGNSQAQLPTSDASDYFLISAVGGS